MPLIGALPQPIASAPAITSAPLVLFIYLVLILLLVTALTSAVVRNTVWAIGSFASSMALLALLFLTIAPFLLFAVQLVIYTTISGGLLLGVLRQTTSLERPPSIPFNRTWIAGGAIAAAVGSLLLLVVAATNWPVDLLQRGVLSLPHPFVQTLLDTYAVGLATLVVLMGSAALGTVLLLAMPWTARKGRELPAVGRGPRRSPS
ncbi:MAG: hypothetical protein E6I99_03925 [Chloroflexi bacterium]|nr:MAG: hypothetical protein E6I99_03925 [Chloroflexota bacterium]